MVKKNNKTIKKGEKKVVKRVAKKKIVKKKMLENFSGELNDILEINF